MPDDVEDIVTDPEFDETPYVEFDISVSPADPTLEVLANKVVQGDIILPAYQRKYVWRIEQASKLIESFLMGLPVPQVFLYVNDDDKLEIIDGQQRILSIKYFFEGYYSEIDSRDNRQIFRLKGLSERSEYNGKTFFELQPRDQRRLKNATLRAIYVKQLKPSSGDDSVFHIFERLNTGGTRLKPQEIRNAVYRGNIVSELKELNGNPDWRNILGAPSPDKNQKDVEIILRLFSLFEQWEQYEKPMLTYLNNQMKINKEFRSERASKFKSRFSEVTKLIVSVIDKPFRPKRVINVAMLEAVMIALLENESITAQDLANKYDELSSDQGFTDSLRGATTDTAVLHKRIRDAKAILRP